LSEVNFKHTYKIDNCFEEIKVRSRQLLGKYDYYDELYKFNDEKHEITFSSERLIPEKSKQRIRILLLFSNPHPHSVKQGMFLSSTTRGQESLFWPFMEESGLLPITHENRSPESLARICLELDYSGLFEYLFYCYYAFPTDYPEDIKKIFGKEYFQQQIEPEAVDEFNKMILENNVQKVITLNKGIFNLVSENPVEKYIDRLKQGDVIQSRLKLMEDGIPIFLTFPTGWRYAKDFKDLRIKNLNQIRQELIVGH
jgi:hypothetical protein